MDGPKDLESGRTAAAVYIPAFKTKLAKRISDHMSEFNTELIAIILVLQWIEEIQPNNIVICTDSMSVLTSLVNLKSAARRYLIYEVLQ